MMPIGDKRRPPSLVLSQDKSKSDMIMRIVSPITPQFVNPNMRDTLKISEVIRLQQNELIAASNYENRQAARRTPLSSNWADAPPRSDDENSSAENVASSENAIKSRGNKDEHSMEVDPETDRSDADHDAIDTDNQPENNSDNDNLNEKNNDSEKGHEEENDENYSISAASPIEIHDQDHPTDPSDSPLGESGIERLGGVFTRKTLKRDNAPGPLRISPGHAAANMAPKISSAPMRPLHGPHAFRRQPVRYVYPNIGPYPQTAIHYVPVAVRRATNVGPERVYKPRSPRATSARRRKPVMDVFEGQVAKLAPMPSQPPSAQVEHFNLSSSEDEKDSVSASTKKEENAAHDDIASQEVGRKRADESLRGTISFNDESAFNFTIFHGNESSAKKKFMEVCETTWDKYMAASESQ